MTDMPHEIILRRLDGTEAPGNIEYLCPTVVTHVMERMVAKASDLERTYPADVLKDRYNPKYRHLFPQPKFREVRYQWAGESRDGMRVYVETP